LLLQQVMAAGAADELSKPTGESCMQTGDDEGTCLAGAPSAEHEEAALLQERAARIRARASQSGALGTPAPEHSKPADAIASAMAEISQAMHLVNSSLAEVIQLVASKSGILTKALDLVKSGVETMRIILGEKAVEATTHLVDKIKEELTPLIAAANATAGGALKEMRRLVDALDLKKDEFLGRLSSAEHLIEALPAKEASLAQVSGWGPFEWFRHIFGGHKPSKSPCDKAKDAVASVNASMQEFEGLVVKLNDTVVSDLLDRATATLRSGVDKLKAAASAAIQGIAASLPPSVKTGVDKAIGLFASVAEEAERKLAASKGQLALVLGKTRAPLAAARAAVVASEAQASKRCS